MNPYKIILIGFLSLMFTHVHQAQEALDQVINEKYENEPISYILKHLDRNYDISIRYNLSQLPRTNVSYDFEKIKLRQALSILLKKNNLNYIEYASDQIIIIKEELLDGSSIDLSKTVDAISISEVIDTTLEIISIGSSDKIGPFLLKGHIREQVENFGIDDVLILDKTSGNYTYTNPLGEYEINLSQGFHELQISSVNHENKIQLLDIQGDGTWSTEMQFKRYFLEDIIISAISEDYELKEVVSGLEQLSKNEIKKLNTFMGENDVIKSIMNLAGVSNIGEGASGFNVRGGNVDQNLILQDGAIILNPSHILGFFSIFNSDIISNALLYKGHIPAQYGGKSSSVLDISLREANNEEFKINGSIGLISSKIAADIPVIHQKSALLVSARSSYTAWWLKNVDNIDLSRSKAQFYDVNAKYVHQLTNKLKLITSYFRSFDRLQFSDDFGYSWKNEVSNTQLRYIISDNTSLGVQGIIGQLSNGQFVPDGSLAFNLSSGMRYKQLEFNALHTSDRHNLRVGVNYLGNNALAERLSPLNESQTIPEEINKENGYDISVYINDQIKLSNSLGIDIGLRYSSYAQTGPGTVNTYEDDFYFSNENITNSIFIQDNERIVSYSNFEPRVSMNFNPSDESSIKLSYDRIAQYVHLLSNTSTPTPLDIWQVSNTHIKPLISNNFSVGLYNKLSDQISLNMEGFYKLLDNTIDHKDFADLNLNPHLETSILLGEGRAYGAELSLKKRGQVLTSNLSYTYSRSQRRTTFTDIETINAGNWFPSNYDTPHEFKLFANWNISKRDRFNVNFIIKTGRPITAPISNFLLHDIVIADFSGRNQTRLPTYHRLDISYTFNLNRRTQVRYRHDVTFSFYNVYARKNAFSVFFRQELGSQINALQLSVIGTMIPSISYNFKF